MWYCLRPTHPTLSKCPTRIVQKVQIIWIADSRWKLVHQLTGPRWAISPPLALASKLLNTNWTAKSSCNSPYSKYYFFMPNTSKWSLFGFFIFDARSLLLGCGVRQLHRALQSNQWGAFQFHCEELGDGLLGNGPEGALNGQDDHVQNDVWHRVDFVQLHIKFKLLSRFFHFKTCRFFETWRCRFQQVPQILHLIPGVKTLADGWKGPFLHTLETVQTLEG